ncbi:MAG: hypothetical protein ABI430_02675 [Candidatus Taylorbacteria bacterium]
MPITLEDISKNNLHHAYCIEGGKDEVYAELLEFIENTLGISTRGNPDFSHLDVETLNIEEGRALKERQQNKSLDGGKKIFVVSANSITREAQNSLLKIFEEPTENTHFFLILPSAEILIPTLKSRLHIVKQTGMKEESVEANEEAKKFVLSSKSARLLHLKSIIEEKDKQKAISFLNLLEGYLASDRDMKKLKKEEVFVLEEIIRMKQYLGDRGASVKMILEYIALIV